MKANASNEHSIPFLPPRTSCFVVQIIISHHPQEQQSESGGRSHNGELTEWLRRIFAGIQAKEEEELVDQRDSSKYSRMLNDNET